MAVRDKDYNWTDSAVALDDELREKASPILMRAIENGMELEDVYYVASMFIDDLLLNIVLTKRSKRNK